ncbi:MAG: hypothetical protein M0R49_08355 [Limnochordia bacterium]|nr:hypothetical protein [Limnochordia bacterium]
MIEQRLSLGGEELEFPESYRNQNMTCDYVIVSGRQATALSGNPLSLGVVRKREWKLSFYLKELYAHIISLLDTETTFIDHLGEEHDVIIWGSPSFSPFPYAENAMVSLVLREV